VAQHIDKKDNYSSFNFGIALKKLKLFSKWQQRKFDLR